MKKEIFQLPNLHGEDAFEVGLPRLSCVAEGWKGNALAGYLLDFDEDHRQIKIQPLGDARPVALKFNQIKRLRLDKNPDTDLEFQPSSLEAVASLHSFVIHLKDGSFFSGIAHAHQKEPYGLWVFPKQSLDGDPFRVFVPRSSINHFEVKRQDGTGSSDADFNAQDFNDTVQADLDAFGVEAAVGRGPTLVETPQDLSQALDNQARLKPVPIGEALLGLGKITQDQLALVLKQQKEKKSAPLGQMLVSSGLVTPADLQTAFARKMGYPFVDLSKFPVDVAALRVVPVALATRLKVMPLTILNNSVVVAMPDPLQFKVIEELEFSTQRKVVPVVTTSGDLAAHITKAYRNIGMLESNGRAAEAAAAATDTVMREDALLLAAELSSDDQATVEERPIEQTDNTLVKLINSMITEAFHQGASDIHIEPYGGREHVVIRFRVDGELRPYLELPASYRNALVARIKIMCDLDISEKRKPQDGKINFSKYGPLKIELRVATIPTMQGMEDVVIRILSSHRALPLSALELAPDNLTLIEDIVERPYGLFLCVGPTGSGKTTTLHAALKQLNKPNRKVWTAEDPVEITQHGLRQIQVNARIGWTFATALRSLLRADPDVIMVGEIRDAETAEIAIEASLTGHMVISTLHTNSATETVTRLIDLGVDPFSFADSLQGILAQRLVRRLCKTCVTTSPMDDKRLKELINDFQMALPLDHPLRDDAALVGLWKQRFGQNGALLHHHAPGCSHCGNTGYRGRLAIHELFAAAPALRQLIQKRANAETLRDAAVSQGMRTLRQDGIEKVLAGLTSLAEVRSSSNR